MIKPASSGTSPCALCKGTGVIQHRGKKCPCLSCGGTGKKGYLTK